MNDMGEAKKRGTFDQRKEVAIERQLEERKKQREEWEKREADPKEHARRSRAKLYLAAALVASGISGDMI